MQVVSTAMLNYDSVEVEWFLSLASYRFLLLMAMWLENEPMRKENWRPGGDDFGYGYGMDGT